MTTLRALAAAFVVLFLLPADAFADVCDEREQLEMTVAEFSTTWND